MGLETVQISVVDDTLDQNPVDGVVLRVFDATGTTLITSGTTSAGLVEVTLSGNSPPTRYQLRTYITGGSIPSPQLIDVYSPASAAPTGTNTFQITATLFTLSQATDPYLCRCSGYVRGPDGKPKKNLTIQFIPEFNIFVVNGAAVLGEREEVRTDADGFVSVDLFRNGVYAATVQSQENVERMCYVPDRASLEIGYLLFPVVASISYDPGGPYSLSVGETIDLTPTLQATDFRTLTGAPDSDVTYSTDDETVASVQVLGDRITITGIHAGTTTLRVKRTDGTIVYVPDPGINGGTVAITVV